jgi:hypothetical protein
MRRSILLPAVALLMLLTSASFTAAQALSDGSQLTPTQQFSIASECDANMAVASKDQARIDSALVCVQHKVAQINEANQKKIALLENLLGPALQPPLGNAAQPEPIQQPVTQQTAPQEDPPKADPEFASAAAPMKPLAPAPAASKPATPEPLKITTYSGSGFYLDLATVITGSNVPTCPCRFQVSDEMPPDLQFATSPGNEPILFGTPSAGDKASYVIKTVAIAGVDDILMVPMTIDIMKNTAQAVKVGGANTVPLAVPGFNGEPYSASFTLKDIAGKACPSIVSVGSQTLADLKSNQQLILTIQGGKGTLTATSLLMTSPITFPVACTAGGQTATISVSAYKSPAAPAVAATAAPHAKIMFAEPLAMPIVEGVSEIKGQVLNIPVGVQPLSAQLWITVPGAQTPALVTLKAGGTSSALAADGTYDLQLSSPLVGGSTVSVQLVASAGVTLPVNGGETTLTVPISPAINLAGQPKLNITSEIIAAAGGSSSTITGTVTMPEFGVAPTATPASNGNYPQISVWIQDPVTAEWSIAQLTTGSGTTTSVPVSDAYGDFSVTLKTPLTTGQRVRLLALPPPGRTFSNSGLNPPPIPQAPFQAPPIADYPLAYETTVPAPLLLVKPTLSNPAMLVERVTTLSGLATPPPTGTVIDVAVVKLDSHDTDGLNYCLTADNLALPNPQDSILSISANSANSLLSATTATTGAYSLTLAMPLNRKDRIQIVQVLPAGTQIPDVQTNKCTSAVFTVNPPYTWESHDGTQSDERTNDDDATRNNEGTAKKKKPYSSPCAFNFNDCDFKYSVIGGIEQADLSAQSSVTEGFYYLYIRSPYNMRWGNLWFTSRYLGAPSSSSTQNVVAASASPATTITASTLPQSVASIDYNVGVERDFFQPTLNNRGSGQWTIGSIFSFGATSPLAANTAVTGFAVPDFGTNECNQLQLRFGSKMGYNPALPPSGYYNTAAAGATPVSSTSEGCIVQPQSGPGITSGTMANPGTQITTIAFSNEDRSSFLLKYGLGVRFIHRTLAPNTTHCSPYGSGDDSTGGLCRRLLADLTIGQDQAITGGYLRRFVFKGDTVVPVLNTGAYFFASSATRLEHNLTLSPLVLPSQTVGISNSTSTCTASATNVCLPSDNIFILPFKQANRDFYRIGIGIDLTTVLKLFTGAASQ